VVLQGEFAPQLPVLVLCACPGYEDWLKRYFKGGSTDLEIEADTDRIDLSSRAHTQQ
jgi:hypothetical protein